MENGHPPAGQVTGQVIAQASGTTSGQDNVLAEPGAGGMKSPGIPARPEACTSSFAKSRRLLKASQYRHVFDQAIRSGDACFTVLARANNLGHARLGLAISKKKARKAVSRNRLKRIVRESFRQRHDLPAVDIVVLAGKQAVHADNSRLFASLAAHWQRIGEQCGK